MARLLQLSSEDREFFSLVVEVVTRNPFSEDRPRVGSLISPGFRHPPTLGEQQFNAALDERLAKLSARSSGRVTDYEVRDRQLVAYAHLFHIYIRIVGDLNQLIREEATARQPAVVPFAGEVLNKLRESGFSEDEALRYFALFYQMRRAFYFIVESLAGESPCMQGLREALWNNVFTHDLVTYDRHLWNRMEDVSLLLLGETGTGKGAAAAAIGRSGFIPFDAHSARFSRSFQKNFIAANLSRFPETLIESELFGHVKGAFTGAVKDHRGLLAHCSEYGSLFLDEIGDLSVPAQVKLLQVLQERVFTPVGSYSQQRFSGRVIAATNRSFDELRSSDTFRDDFFYRLCSDVITVPPLRQRLTESPSELQRLVVVVILRILGTDVPEVTSRVVEILNRDIPADYPWPGNVRELEQAVRRVLVTGHYRPHVPVAAVADPDALARTLAASKLSMSDLATHYCAALYEQFGSYQAVARHTRLDSRTVKKHLSGMPPD